MSVGFDPNLLLGFYQSKLTSSLSTATAQAAAGSSATSNAAQKSSATANDSPPWQAKQLAQNAMDAAILATTDFLDTSNIPLSASTTADQKTEQDNQKLFSLYSAVNKLAYLAKMAQRESTTSGQLAGLNTRFQAGLKQVGDFIANSTFNNFTLQAAAPSATVTSSVVVPFGSFDYQTKTLVNNANLNNPLPGLSTSDSFDIAIKKGGTTTNVAIDLSQVQGALTLDNIVSYVNQALSAGGFATRFQKVLTAGTLLDASKATYGLQVSPGGTETVSLSSAAATPSLYLVGSSGQATTTSTTTTTAGTTTTTSTPADQQGRLIKLSNIDSTPTSTVSVNAAPTTGTTTANASVVDTNGNIYVLGNATGDFGNQVNQGSQDAYLTKYDSAGNVLWTRLLGSTGTASGSALALDSKGGVVITGASNADLSTASVANGNTDTYVARYDADGNQTWIKQLQTLSTNQAATVSVDASGNVYIGGQVSGGVIGNGQTKFGGTDAYVAKLDSKGNIVYESQFGTSANDSVAATAAAADGSLYVASVQNGHAIVSKYANGDATRAPVWQQDLGDLQNGGGIGGLAISGNQIYVSGTTQNANLTAGGAASIANAASGGSDAFVFNITDQGASSAANYVSYVGTGAVDKGGQVTVASDGTVYLTGTTSGTLSGQIRNVANVNNAFAAALAPNGTIDWTKQYGGQDGISNGAAIAVDSTGSSVLDALGLPKGSVNPVQSVDLTSQTALRAGDSFQIQIQGVATRTATITIDLGETLQSLATKINIQLQTYGKASVNYTGGAEGLKIAVNPGQTISLLSGPAQFDALKRLGIAAGTLSAPAATNSKNASSSSAASTSLSGSGSSATRAFGLGLGTIYDISSKTGADLARSQLLGVLSKVQSAYQTTNAPSTPPTGPGNTTGTASPYLTSQLSSYNLALNLLSNSASSSGPTQA